MIPKLDPTLDFQADRDSAVPASASRRDFLKRLGGGVIVFVTFGDWASWRRTTPPER